jgi:signal transduction histidine kinase
MIDQGKTKDVLISNLHQKQETTHEEPINKIMRSFDFKIGRRVILVLLIAIFISEGVIMLVLKELQIQSYWLQTIFDSLFLLFLTFPVIYFFVINPLKLQIAERKLGEEELRIRSRELSVLLNSSKSLATLKLETVLQRTTDSITELMDLQSSAIYLLEGETLFLGATSPALPSDFPEEFRRAPLSDHPHINRAIFSLLPVFIPDTATVDLTSAERSVSEQRGLRSILYLPLIVKTEAIGVLIVAKVGEPRILTTSEIELCRTLASIAALALENARLYEKSKQEIIERKKIELEILKAKEHAEENDRLKTAFLANMSHEIRTPMNGILGFAELLKDPDLSGDKQEEYIKIIEMSGARMLSTINDIIEISKIESGQMEVDIMQSNINEQIKYLYTFFKPEVEGKGMRLHFINALPDNEAIVRTDPEKLYGILTNLIKNSIKFSEKGSIDFGYDVVRVENARFLRFYVKDTGIGIHKDRQEAIFERFVQADVIDSRAFQGSGLGLSISRAYVEKLEGKIWVESEEEKGSVFYFTIPYNPEQTKEGVFENEVPLSEIEDQINPGNTRPKVLIAEDDEISERLISLEIGKYCREILKVKTGNEAVEICRNNKDIDLVLMDIKMPGLNGYEATRLIRQFNKDVIIIAQTAYAFAGESEKAIEAGCNDYISKPIGKDKLYVLLRKHFN